MLNKKAQRRLRKSKKLRVCSVPKGVCRPKNKGMTKSQYLMLYPNGVGASLL